VQVAGLSTEQISAKLQDLLAKYYVDPEVVVNVARYASQHYYIFGEVTKPGPRLFTGRDTLLRALAEARPTFLAWRTQIRVTRPADTEDGESKTIVVDLDEMVRTGDLTKDVLLQPGDIVEVPPTPLAWVGLRVRELLFPVTPVLDLYNAPADAIRSTRIYEDEFGSSNDDYDDRY
jgi:polysaccharide export outer membrane protein